MVGRPRWGAMGLGRVVQADDAGGVDEPERQRERSRHRNQFILGYAVLVAPATTTPRDAHGSVNLYDGELRHLPKAMERNEGLPRSAKLGPLVDLGHGGADVVSALPASQPIA